jgi:CheY-like chemotaxis protein
LHLWKTIYTFAIVPQTLIKRSFRSGSFVHDLSQIVKADLIFFFAEIQPNTGKNMNPQLNCILLIDDDEPTNFLNKMTLEQTGCTRHISVAQSGQEALDYLRGCGPDNGHGQGEEMAPRPDLIFLDINMPAMDGWEFLERYKTLPSEKKADIVLIMLTTSLNPDDEVKTRTIPEVAGFENKPLSQHRLRVLLEKYFSN